MNDTLMSLKVDLRLIASQLSEGKSAAYDELETTLQQSYARVYAFSRRELGFNRESSIEPDSKLDQR